MNELLKYEKSISNYPKKTIKEMENLLKNSQKEEFLTAHMHVILHLTKSIYKLYPEYFKTNSIMDTLQLGNMISVEAYNKGIRDYSKFSYYIYLSFYRKMLRNIKLEGKKITYGDNIIDEDMMVEDLDRKLTNEEIRKAIGDLSELRQQIYNERYEELLPLRHISQIHGISCEMIRKHEKKIQKHIIIKTYEGKIKMR